MSGFFNFEEATHYYIRTRAKVNNFCSFGVYCLASAWHGHNAWHGKPNGDSLRLFHTNAYHLKFRHHLTFVLRW